MDEWGRHWLSGMLDVSEIILVQRDNFDVAVSKVHGFEFGPQTTNKHIIVHDATTASRCHTSQPITRHTLD
jgi:hypothetical protein